MQVTQFFYYIASIMLRVNKYIFGNIIFTSRYGIAKGFKRQFGYGFKLESISEEVYFLQNLDLDNLVVYDLGAYIGLYTMFFSKKVNTGTVISFEPNFDNYVQINSNIKYNNIQNVMVFNMAIGSKQEELWFLRNKIFPTRGKVVNTYEKGSIRVQVSSLDDLIKKQNLPLPDLLKIDVEGFELEVLQGMTDVLKIKKPNLFIEIHDKTFIDVINILNEYNYRLYHVENRVYINRYDGNLINGHIYCSVRS